MMSKVKKIIFTQLLLLILVLSACGNREERSVTVVDMEGTEVVIRGDIRHVACMSQSATDFMIAFGLGDRIKGTYKSFCYNKWTEVLYPGAKDYIAYSYSTSAEELLKDGIDLVITQNTENADAYRNAGIPVVAVHQYSPTGAFDDEMYDTARLIGKIFGVEEKAAAWEAEVRETIADIETRCGTVNSGRAVYYINGEKAKGLYYSDGGNSMISRILAVANMELATEKYEVLNVHKVSDEEMVRLDPYSIMIGGGYQNRLNDELNDSPIWSSLTSVSEGRVYRIPVCMVGIENVSCETSLMLKYTASLFGDYSFDRYAETRACIEKYFGYTLTDAEIDKMYQGLSPEGERMENGEQ